MLLSGRNFKGKFFPSLFVHISLFFPISQVCSKASFDPYPMPEYVRIYFLFFGQKIPSESKSKIWP